MSQLKTKNHIHISGYVIWVFIAMAAAQFLGFYVTRLALPYLTLHDMTGPLDDLIPFSPPWITVYFLSFPYWIFTAFWILLVNKTYAYRAGSAYILAMLISAAFFLLYPGTMERPEITGGSFFDKWMLFLYDADAPVNLCPSLHVLITYYCWRETIRCTGIPKWYKIASFIFLPIVCCSVLFVKQHALVDVPCGILVGEFALQCARLFRLERIPFAIERHFHKE